MSYDDVRERVLHKKGLIAVGPGNVHVVPEEEIQIAREAGRKYSYLLRHSEVPMYQVIELRKCGPLCLNSKEIEHDIHFRHHEIGNGYGIGWNTVLITEEVKSRMLDESVPSWLGAEKV